MTNDASIRERSGPDRISPDRLYSRKQVMEFMGWRTRAWAVAKRKGLVTHRFGVYDYVAGEELIRFIRSLSAKGKDE